MYLTEHLTAVKSTGALFVMLGRSNEKREHSFYPLIWRLERFPQGYPILLRYILQRKIRSSGCTTPELAYRIYAKFHCRNIVKYLTF